MALYSSSLGQIGTAKWITVNIVSDPASETGVTINLQGNQQFVVVYLLESKQYRIYEIPNSGLLVESFPKQSQYVTTITYIYGIPNLQRAQLYADIYPFQAGFKPNITIDNSTNVSLIAVIVRGDNGRWAGIANIGNTDIFICDVDARSQTYSGRRYHLLPQSNIFIETANQLAWMVIRDTEHPQGISYRDLTYMERHIYIPKSVLTGKTQIHTGVPCDWVYADEHLYRGTLTYVPTTDKEFHMIDGDGRKYQYGIDQIRDMIPHMNRGVISGTFKYAPRGMRNIKYVLVPCAVTYNDLEICNSSDSESDSELETDFEHYNPSSSVNI